MSKGVMIITPFFSPNLGGVETHLDDLINVLNENKIYSIVSTYEPLVNKHKCNFDYIEINNYSKIYRLKWFGIGWFNILEKKPFLVFIYLFPGLFIQSYILLIFNKKNINIIHAQGIVSAAIAVILGKLFTKKIVFSTHANYELDDNNSLQKKIFKLISSNCDSILTLSFQSKKQFEKITSSNKIKTYSYWVNQDIFNFPQVDKFQIRLKDYKNVLFIGRLIDKKGIKLLPLIAKNLKYNQIRIIVVGSGPGYDYLRYESESLDNLLVFPGIKNSELPYFYANSDVLLIPSLYQEGMARVKMEALSCGIPIVATMCDGLMESMDLVSAIFVEPLLENFTSALIEMLDRANDKTFLRKYAINKFSVNNSKVILNEYN